MPTESELLHVFPRVSFCLLTTITTTTAATTMMTVSIAKHEKVLQCEKAIKKNHVPNTNTYEHVTKIG